MSRSQEKTKSTPRSSRPTAADDARTTIPVIKEEIHVDKHSIETGRVIIHKSVQEREVALDIPLNQEVVEVKRVALNHYVDDNIPETRREGETTIIPVLREVVVKRTLLVEEIHITRTPHPD